MSLAVVCVAVAALVWPDGRPVGRARLDAPGRRWASTTTVRAGSLRSAAGRGGRAPQPSARGRFHLLPAAAAAAAAGGAAVASTWLVALLAGVGAGLAARAWAARSARGDAAARLTALTEALGVLAAELRSGRHLEAAVATTVESCPDAGLGASLARALRVPGVDDPDPDVGDPVAGALDRVSAAVLLSQRTGCSLSAVVGAVEDDLRARGRQLGELRSAVAGPRASAALLAALPILGLAMGTGIGADPWRVLTTTGTGQALLVLGVSLEWAGLAWSRRLVRGVVR